MPTYMKSLFPIPDGVIERLDALRRNFLWEGNSETKKFHLVKWDALTGSKQKGGMGVRNLKTQNQCLMMKWLWRLPSSELALWKEVIQLKYEMADQVLENLQSVSGLNPSCCTKEIFDGIKKVKQLGICNLQLKSSSDPKCLDNLVYLHELESLSIVSYSLPRLLPCAASFPPNLKKLTLCKTFLLWEDMAIISKLPKLEILQLKAQAFACSEDDGETVWEITDMVFPELKFFLLEWLDLKYWRATDDYFPCLERIIIRNCRMLKEIPEVLADSVTLQLIELRGCSSSLVTFAMKIQENHEDLGNDILKVDAFDTIRDAEEEATKDYFKKEEATKEEAKDSRSCFGLLKNWLLKKIVCK